MNYAKFNHILIPATKEERERLLNTRKGLFFRLVFRFFLMFSREGQIIIFLWMIVSALSLNLAFTQYYVIWGVISALLFSSLAMRRFARLEGVKLNMNGPPRVTVGDVVHLNIELKNNSEHTHQAIRIERPFLPWDGTYLSEKPSFQQIEPGQTQRATLSARFIARGEHHLDTFSARMLAPFGLALGPPIEATHGVHFLVIPKIANVVQINTDITQKHQPGGVALASITGESRELVGVRPYRPGDPIRDLHVKTWARIGQPVVREYQQEYFTRIGIIIDTDGAKSDDPSFEAMLSLAAGIVAQLSRGEALLDLLVIGEDFHQLTLGRSLGFLEQALDLLACVDPKETFRIDLMQSQLIAHLERLSSMIFLSLKWDEPRLQLVQWIETQGVRCKKLAVFEKDASTEARNSGAVLLKSDDILQEKELIL